MPSWFLKMVVISGDNYIFCFECRDEEYADVGINKILCLRTFFVFDILCSSYAAALRFTERFAR